MKEKYVKLPNGRIVSINQAGYVTVEVEVPMAEVLATGDKKNLWGKLWAAGTGSDKGIHEAGVEADIWVCGHAHWGLTFGLRGKVGGIRGVLFIRDEEIGDYLPMREFQVDVTRVGYGCRTLSVTARTAEEARYKADDVAGNYEYGEHHSDYLFEARPAEIVVNARSIENVLHDYSLRVTDTQGKSFETLSHELEDEIDCKGIEERARAVKSREEAALLVGQEIRRALVKIGVLDF